MMILGDTILSDSLTVLVSALLMDLSRHSQSHDLSNIVGIITVSNMVHGYGHQNVIFVPKTVSVKSRSQQLTRRLQGRCMYSS